MVGLPCPGGCGLVAIARRPTAIGLRAFFSPSQLEWLSQHLLRRNRNVVYQKLTRQGGAFGRRQLAIYKSAIADSYGASCQARSISATAISSDSLSADVSANVSAPSAVRRRSITHATVFSGLGEGSTCKTANEKTMASEAATSIAAVQRRREQCSATWANDSAAAARSISARRGGDRAMPSSSRPFTKSSISRYSFISIPPTSLSILASQCAST